MSGQNQEFATRRTYFTAIITVLVFIAFMAIMYTINSGIEFSWEKPIQHYFQAWNEGTVQLFFTYWTELGSRIGIGLATLLLVVWIWTKQKDYVAVALVAITVALTDRLNGFVKHLVARDRPSINPAIDAVGYSFPSGHAMLSIFTYSLIAYFLAKSFDEVGKKFLIWLAAIVVIVLTGISRIVLSAHYPSDVIAGYCLGLVCFILTIKLYKLLVPILTFKKKVE
ncbi:phosphatase PAP2 family protein [Bacillus sp. AGMB 02131]|uniref:Phosphatase PAP2 family protein n=1 Tax=Peribacillus faecalis TaxID=2772559 RepID=A0A927D375_9BACI|nr:phosphatase PAP2 family protein [Peribacillus faecalis]MBD3110264.1 phosphatase PAP2 family protein [Peribacillus faecalis]